MNLPHPTLIVHEDSGIRTAAALEAAAQREGFCPGWPAWLTDENRVTDQRISRQLRCPACKSRCTSKPYTNERRRRYRIVCACTRCPAGEIQ